MQNGIIAGFGFMGGMHAQIYLGLHEAEIVAVVDPDAEAATAKLRELGMTNAKLFSTLGEALAGAEADFVDVCYPTFMHAAAAREAIRAGRAVFCEKPLAMSVEEGEAIVVDAERASVTLMTGHCIRFWPEYVALKKLVDSGEAGRLLSLTLQRRASRPAYTKDQWIRDPKLSLGAALDLHIHDTDFISYLLGRPRFVQSQGVRDEGGWSHIFTRYDYEGGPEVQAEGGWNYPPKWGFLMAFQAVFESGAMEYDSNASPTTRVIVSDGDPHEAELTKAEAGESRLGEGNVSDLGGYQFELAHFIDSLEAGTPPKTATGHDALESLRITFAEIKSAETRKPQTIES